MLSGEGSGGCHLYIGIVICCLTFFAKCGILDFEGIPETVGGSLSLGESAVAISAGRRAGRFLLLEGSEWYGIRNLVRFDSVQYPDRCYYSIDARYFP